MDFCQALTRAYRENPCQVLPNALWKTRSALAGRRTSHTVEAGQVVHLEIWGQEQLYLYWDRGRRSLDVPAAQLERLELVLIQQDYVANVPRSRFAVQQAYFRLLYHGGRAHTVPAGYVVREVRIAEQAGQVAGFINQCYEDLAVTVETVRCWTDHPVFDPHLWVWVVTGTGELAGLGIAEYDAAIREGSLEWVQVLPQYRRRGVGQGVVGVLVQRLEDRARWITVSGRSDSASGPERLYRSCGFGGDDLWWVMRR